jgi:DNA invertase Pin-like site-specific DNA recombinase
MIAYLRTSTKEQHISMEVQLETIQRKYGDNVKLVIRDFGVSSQMALESREGGQALIKAIAGGEYSAVGVARLDRLFRNVKDTLTYLDDWAHHNIELVALDLPFNLSSALGRAMLSVSATFAELERSQISERVKRALAQAQHEGKWVGRPNYGYTCSDGVLSVDERQMSIIRLICLRHSQGRSPRSTAYLLRGDIKKWSVRSIRRIINRHSQHFQA